MPLIGVGACVSIQFGVVQYFKRLFGDENAKRGRQDLSHVQLYTSGLAGGIANSVLAGPIEHVRIRMQTQKGNELRGPFDALRQIAARGGVSSVFRGMGPTVLREGHGMGIYFLTYEYLVQKKLQADKISREQLPNTTSMLAGAAAGTVVRALRSPQLWLMVYPIEYVAYLTPVWSSRTCRPTRLTQPSAVSAVRSMWCVTSTKPAACVALCVVSNLRSLGYVHSR